MCFPADKCTWRSPGTWQRRWGPLRSCPEAAEETSLGWRRCLAACRAAVGWSGRGALAHPLPPLCRCSGPCGAGPRVQPGRGVGAVAGAGRREGLLRLRAARGHPPLERPHPAGAAHHGPRERFVALRSLHVGRGEPRPLAKEGKGRLCCRPSSRCRAPAGVLRSREWELCPADELVGKAARSRQPDQTVWEGEPPAHPSLLSALPLGVNSFMVYMAYKDLYQMSNTEVRPPSPPWLRRCEGQRGTRQPCWAGWGGGRPGLEVPLLCPRCLPRAAPRLRPWCASCGLAGPLRRRWGQRSGVEIAKSIHRRPRPSESTVRHGQSRSQRAHAGPCRCQGLRLKGRVGCRGHAQAGAVCLLGNRFFLSLF